MPYVETSKGRLFYTESRGEVAHDVPLILIHGAGSSHLDWPEELRNLPGYRVLAPDLPGHGRSEGPLCLTIAECADAVTRFMDAMGIERAILVGHSMGGAIAQWIALDKPGYAAGLALVGTGARLKVSPKIMVGLQEDFENTVDRIVRYSWAPDAPRELVEMGRQMLLEAGQEVLLRDFRACDKFDVMLYLGRITAPTLVISGELDSMTPPRMGEYIAERVRRSSFILVPGAGHMMALEKPDEVVSAIREEFGKNGA